MLERTQAYGLELIIPSGDTAIEPCLRDHGPSHPPVRGDANVVATTPGVALRWELPPVLPGAAARPDFLESYPDFRRYGGA